MKVGTFTCSKHKNKIKGLVKQRQNMLDKGSKSIYMGLQKFAFLQ